MLAACPDPWELPTDSPPSNQGSYKGYTNQYTFSNTGGPTDYEGWLDHNDKPMQKFSNESVNMNEWDKISSAATGCMIGFIAFGLGIIYAVIMIVIDMRKRKAMYEELIQEDLQKMQ